MLTIILKGGVETQSLKTAAVNDLGIFLCAVFFQNIKISAVKNNCTTSFVVYQLIRQNQVRIQNLVFECQVLLLLST